MLHYLRMELKNLMPVIQQRESSDKIFSIFAKNCDEYSFPFLCYCVELMTSETSSAPTADLVTAIRDFIDKREGREPIVPDVATDISVAEPVVRQQLSGITENDNFMLMVNVIGGISLPELEANLPRIIGLYKSDIESLKSVFRKLTRGRPPPMSKPSLLAYLHR